MYERFTDRARKVVKLSCQEAREFNHEYVGTEHILLGLVSEGTGVGISVLKRQRIDLQLVVAEVKKIVQAGLEIVTAAKLPQTPRAKKAIEFAMDEARMLNHNYVGTEHLLLGLLKEEEGVAGHVLRQLGLTLEQTRSDLIAFLDEGDTLWKQS